MCNVPCSSPTIPQLLNRFLFCLLTLLLAGCASQQRQHPESILTPGDISEIHLLAMPLALDLDKTPGADGFAIKVYAVSRKEPKTQKLRSGHLEIRMYDGILQSSPPPTNQLVRTWSLSADELTLSLFQSPIGVGYALTPRWENHRPSRDKISVTACYLPPSGPAVCSAPSVITVVSQ